jgi:hypothetical protein
MGSNSSSGGGGGEGPANRYQKPPKKKNPIIEFVKGGGVVGAVVRGIKNANKKSKQNLMDYEGQAAGVTPMRSPNINTPDRDGGNNNLNTVVPLTTVASTAPTTAEVSQATATDATDATDTVLAEDILLRNKKTKKKGRSMTILTSSKGIKSDEELTLGKKSLLGS